MIDKNIIDKNKTFEMDNQIHIEKKKPTKRFNPSTKVPKVIEEADNLLGT